MSPREITPGGSGFVPEEEGVKVKSGTVKEFPAVFRSEHPIDKDRINAGMLEFIYGTFPAESEELRGADFEVEFIYFANTKGFIRVHIKSGNQRTLEVQLLGAQLSEFGQHLASAALEILGDDVRDPALN